ncbi:MarP family serine protease [Lawsonella clevelandensis]|uniref:Serine protease n=1 Tax=Lawsonella clevelandensis TaxID=1528099 RepID=A0A5E3ZY22_9ACTN|nr:MarP family serine protease [Lawsonella clevelandensis]VHO01076.1 Serine protease [Lawsonella clevelandensis]
MSALTFDILALLAFIVFGAYGWVTGFTPSLYGFFGATIGIIIEYFTLPYILSATTNGQLRFIVGITYGFVLVSFCSVGAEILGLYIRDRLGLQKSRISRMAGSLFKIFLAAVLIWVFFSPLSVQPNTHLGKVMRESRVMTVIDTFAPNAAQKIPEMLDDSARTASLQQMTGRSSQFAGSGIPDDNIVETPSIVKARRSVVKIVGEATDCHRKLEGTGFIYSPGLVVTNAHVVAGARIIRVHTVKGVFRARPIVFDAMRDVAVLWVPEISSNRLVLPALLPTDETTVEAGQAVVVPGFPNNGPYRVAPARLLEHFILQGPGIYGTTIVERQAYALLGGVMSGNSGGPLLNLKGQYLGIVFGVATDKNNTAYALSYSEVEPVLRKAMTTREKVSTGRCVPLETEVTQTTVKQS